MPPLKAAGKPDPGVVAAAAARNHALGPFLLPLRSGPPRPTLQQAISDPCLRKTYLGLNDEGDGSAENEGTTRSLACSASVVEGFDDLALQLDKTAAARKALMEEQLGDQRRKRFYERLHLRSEKANKYQPKAWVLQVPAGHEINDMTGQRIGGGTTGASSVAGGIYGPGIKPPHADIDNGDWCRAHTKNKKGEIIGFFQPKTYEVMGPTERKFADRLTNTLERHTKADVNALRDQTDGARKRQIILDGASPGSALGGCMPWVSSDMSNHKFFSYVSPLNHGDFLSPDTQRAILQPDRTTNNELDIVVNDGGKSSFWHQPAARSSVGSSKAVQEAHRLFSTVAQGKAEETGT